MSFDLTALLALGEIDAKLNATRRRLSQASLGSVAQGERVETAKKEVQRLVDQAKHGEREVKRLEGEAEAKKQAITKNEIALNTAKSNDEYQALLRAIDGHKQELNDIETKILEAYEAQDRQASESKAARDRLTATEKDFAAAQGRVKDTEGELGSQISELEAQRVAAASNLSSDILDHYERLLEKVGDTAIARVLDEMCQGCYTKIRPNQISQIRGRKELVICWDCGRMLYGDFEEN